ncbi:MAG: molybdopterin-guanine dinucleotide biosynthesis protein B, partial [Dehalococcoidia bacterium]
PVVAVVGNSDAGKTQVASSLVEILSGQGYRVAVVKHCPHGHNLDRPESDTHRVYGAGATTVVASSPGKRTTVDKVEGDSSLESIISSLGTRADMVIAEGFKTSTVPKVLVVKGRDPPPSVENVIATVGDGGDVEGVPAYGFEDVDKLASQLCAQILEVRHPVASVSLTVDGAPIPLFGFPSRALAGIVRGFLSGLKGVPEDPEEIEIAMRRGPSAS